MFVCATIATATKRIGRDNAVRFKDTFVHVAIAQPDVQPPSSKQATVDETSWASQTNCALLCEAQCNEGNISLAHLLSSPYSA
ncbi:unnamed protein product [Protopolystoma xenopodis]|uniref:Uncharacterized protein n=1 Tax=Protopolystoma xenopodis TaxID=117903 RepID=A0A3S5CLU2_9PLAT|nr:unnamed protein product [Protopolystoma xenopodis]